MNRVGDNLSEVKVECAPPNERGFSFVSTSFNGKTHTDRVDVHSAFHRQKYREEAKRRLRIIGTWSPGGGENVSGVYDDIEDKLLAAAAAVATEQPQLQERFATSEQIFETWAQGVIDREKPSRIRVAPYGMNLAELNVGGGLVTLIGAPPGAGKTAIVCQAAFDALRQPDQEHIRLLLANVEMSPQSLLNRQLARLSGVGHSFIHHRDYDRDALPRIEAAIDELRELMPRVEFMRPPFTLRWLRESAEGFDANLVVADYLQRFGSDVGGTDQRMQTNSAMSVCRELADEGRAVIVVSAVSRQKGAHGSNYSSESMGLASFRESSELEYGADDAYILERKEDNPGYARLRCVKNRHGSLADIELEFDGAHQQFNDPPVVFLGGGFDE